jgi:hypothetical protein
MRLTRRSVLRSAGTLPFLRAFEAAAQTGQEPTRFIFFRHPHGVVKSAWCEAGASESDFRLGPILAALEPHRQQIMVLDGLTNMAGQNTGEPHPLASLLVGIGGGKGRHAGISLDQLIAREIGKDAARRTPFDSLVLGSESAFDKSPSLSASGPGAPIPVEEDPRRLFDRVFAGVRAEPQAGGPAGSNGLAAQRREERRSILDLVRGELDRLRDRAGTHHAQLLERHLESLRSIERRLDMPSSSSGAACAPPEAPGGGFPDYPRAGTEHFGPKGRLMHELVAAALGCGLTRVVTMNYGRFVDERLFPWLGIDAPHHGTSHAGDGSLSAQEMLIKIYTWYGQQFAHLVDQLAKTPSRTGKGSLLEHTVLVWGSEVSKGNTHGRTDMPFVIVGRANGYLGKGNRYIRFSGQPTNDLYVNVCHAMGVRVDRFGAYGSGPLPGLAG